MHTTARSRFEAFRRQQWLGLPLALALGGLLVGLLFAVLPAGGAAAAPPAEPAVAYPCSQAGLDAALAAGGSATFGCVGPTTVVITPTGPKLVNKNVTLDGGNNLILSGGGLNGVFTVAAGIHLNLLNLTVRDSDAGVYNNGFLAVTHTHFISNSAGLGAAVFNAPGATASLFASTFETNTGKGAPIWNGPAFVSTTKTATMTVINSTFFGNAAGDGGAIFNYYGLLTVSGSQFSDNHAFSGGAIYNFSRLRVDSSQFVFNGAGSLVLANQAQAPDQPAGPGLPAGSLPGDVGGAIYASPDADTIIATSAFTDNHAAAGGGAVFNGVQPTFLLGFYPNNLAISGSSFVDNCSGGGGGALNTSFTATVSGSSFDFNFADSGASPCVSWAASRPGTHLPAGGSAPANPPPPVNGAGGAIFNSGRLAVANTSFLQNTATFTDAGGGGAIANYTGSLLTVGNSTFTENAAQQSGGAIYNDIFALATIAGSSFTHNTAQNDSGGAIATLGPLTATDTSFVRNGGAPGTGVLVSPGGGAIFVLTPAIRNGPAVLNGQANRALRPSAQAPQGIGPAARLYLEHDTFISNSSEYEGGAIDGGNTTVIASTFMSNTAAWGGALNVWGAGMTISASTFLANQSLTTTLWNAAQGGAIDTNGSSVALLNSTFYHNRAQGFAVGGAINVDPSGFVTVTNSTLLSNTADIPANGGAFSNGGSALLHNVLVALNGSVNCASAVTLSGANLEFPGTTCGGASVQANPLALAPANNGGPTLTSALLAGSPARDVAASDSGCPSTDQRGAHRPVGAHCDIGAFEFGGQVPWLWLPLMSK